MNTNFEAANAAYEAIGQAIRFAHTAKRFAIVQGDSARADRARALIAALESAECDALALCLHDMGRAPA